MSGWHRTSRHERGLGWAWEKARAKALSRDRHLCQHCLTDGRVMVATEVHHVTPRAKGGTDDLGNLISLCSPCHRKADAVEHGRTMKPRTTFTRDGRPVW